jgi:multidrug efflux pump subunit AcrB
VLNIRLGGSRIGHSRFYNATEPFFVNLDKGYRALIRYVIKHKWIPITVPFVCLIMIYVFSRLLKSELAPLEDHSILRASITLPEGADFDYTNLLVDRISQQMQDSVPETRLTFARTGGGGGGASSTNLGGINLFLTEPNQRAVSQQQVYDKLIRIFRRYSEARIIPNQEQTIATSMGSGSQLPVQFVIQNLDFNKLQQVLPKFLDEARKDPVFSNVDVNLKFNKPEINLTVDRLKATNLGVNESDISTTLQLALSGRRYDYFLRNGKQYQIIGQVERSQRSQPADITSLYVRSRAGRLIQLDNLVKTEESSSPPTLYHFNRYKSATISASLAQGRTLGEGITEMRKIAGKLLDTSFHTDLFGSSRDFVESSSNISFALVFALILIYLILAAQFESFRDPFIIMITVPLALAGALLSLLLFKQTLNIFSEIGMIMLIGIVTKNGILIVEFANQKRKAGLKIGEAAFEAAALRLRPILMTSLATIFGALPIALALGAGAQSRVPLGIVVVGGLLFALILTLFVIPVMYILMADKKLQHTISATINNEIE